MSTENFRLAFREQGGSWNCYLAPMNTMDGAKLIASLAMPLARIEGVNEAFRLLMKDAVDGLMQATSGARVVDWNTTPAPEHERAGHA